MRELLEWLESNWFGVVIAIIVLIYGVRWTFSIEFQ